MSLKKINYKLTTVFALLFALNAVILYAVTFILLITTLRQEDHSILKSRLLGYWAQYQSSGMDHLIENIYTNNLLSGERPFFIRIINRENKTIYLTIPERWKSFNFNILAEYPPQIDNIIVLSSKELHFHLEVGAIQLSNGYYLQAGMSDETRRNVVSVFQRNYLLILIFLIILSFTGGSFLTARYLKPIHSLNRAAKHIIDTGKIDQRIPENSKNSELYELIVSFNLMLQRIETLVNGMRDALDAVAHDLRTPMTRFRGTAEMALKGKEDVNIYKNALAESIEESDKIISMLNTLMDISEAETGVLKLDKKELNLNDLINEVIDLYSLLAEEKGLKIQNDVYKNFQLQADPVRLRQVLGNMLDNAVKYTDQHGEIGIKVSQEEDWIIIKIRDSGQGIPEEEIGDIWNRLFRGKDAKEGFGLGLSLVKAIVEAHKWKVSVESTLGRGTEFSLFLPFIQH